MSVMEVKELKSFYRTKSTNISLLSDSLSSRVNVKHQDPLYPTSKFSKIILTKNRDIHNKIQEALTSERKNRFLFSMQQEREYQIKLLKMPKIKKITTKSEINRKKQIYFKS